MVNDYLDWVGPNNTYGFGGPYPASDGVYFLDLTSTDDQAPYGGVEQTVATTNGNTYQLSFDLGSSRYYNAQGYASVTVQINHGLPTTFTFQTNDNVGWHTETLSFVATGASTTIDIIGAPSLNTSTYSAIGLDNVSLVQTAAAVPEPSTLALLSLGGIGVFGRMFRRKSLSVA